MNIEDEYEGQLYFILEELYCCTLRLKIVARHTIMNVYFDQHLSDGVPGMIQMYNELKQGRPYDFYIDYDDVFSFETSDIEGDTVLFTVTCEPHNDADWEEKISQRLDISWLLRLFDKFFDDLLHHPDFPYQYPCCGMYEEPENGDLDDLVDQYMEEHHVPSENYEEVEKLIDRQYLKRFSDDDNGEYMYTRFVDMLTNRRVPKNWAINRIHGVDTPTEA